MDTPITTGSISHFALTVVNKDKARDFYCDVLGFKFLTEFGPKYLLSNGQTLLALASSPDPAKAIPGDAFDENRVGLDHISFNVGSRDEMEQAMRKFDELGVSHGEIKDLGGLEFYVMAFRDPDNIQLELTAPKK